jgi:hypothetical protein
MIESPVLRDFLAKHLREVVLDVLRGRFGHVPPDVLGIIGSIDDAAKLHDWAKLAATCPDFDVFSAVLAGRPEAPAT